MNNATHECNCFVGDMSKRRHPEPTKSIQSTKIARRLGQQGIHLTFQSKNIIMKVRKDGEVKTQKTAEQDSDSTRSI